jgi:hypothetical protein
MRCRLLSNPFQRHRFCNRWTTLADAGSIYLHAAFADQTGHHANMGIDGTDAIGGKPDVNGATDANGRNAGIGTSTAIGARATTTVTRDGNRSGPLANEGAALPIGTQCMSACEC